MKKIINFLITIVVFFLISSCTNTVVNSEVVSLEFITAPATAILDTETQLEAIIKANKKNGGSDTYTLIISSEGATLKKGTSVINSVTINVSGQRFGLVAVRTAPYEITLVMDSATLKHSYRVISNEMDAYFAGGNGTLESPYLISNAQELSNIRLFNGSTYHYFKLTNDIDMSNLNWIPIGTVNYAIAEDGYQKIVITGGFYGELDGNNYSIKNYTVQGDVSSKSGSIALFTGSMLNDDTHTLRNKLKNLSFTNVNINASNVDEYQASVLFGACSNIEFINVKVSGNVVITNPSKQVPPNMSKNLYPYDELSFGVFGSIGRNQIFTNCESNVIFTAKGQSYVYNFGGYIGWLTNHRADAYLTVTGSKNRSKLILEDQATNTNAGAFVGISYSRGTVTFTNTNNNQEIIKTNASPLTSLLITDYTSSIMQLSQDASVFVARSADYASDSSTEVGKITISNSYKYIIG